MEVKRIPAGVYAANCYIITDESTKETAVIDPGGDADDLIKAITEMDVHVKYILLTHGHIDHTGAAVEVKEKFNIPMYINKEDYELSKRGDYVFGDIEGKVDDYISEGDTFKLGNSEIKCIHTPGHTPGGMCFLVNNLLFTGDTLFAGSIGRTDFAGGDFNTIIQSIRNKILELSDDIIVLPGHGPQSSVGKERVHNPFL